VNLDTLDVLKGIVGSFVRKIDECEAKNEELAIEQNDLDAALFEFEREVKEILNDEEFKYVIGYTKEEREF